MATAARFGRLPRSSPSLTSTIVALAQEYQRVRESNIVDAWKNGGLFEGKKVTDNDVLKWMKDRRNELSPDDPKWDYYNNQVSQYTFAIANSKMELEYKRNNKSDADMVAFYHAWAAKLPVGSEAYREREKLAAGYADRAASGRASSGRAAADRAYASSLSADYKKGFAHDAMQVFLEGEAHDRGILKGNETLANVDPNTADGRAINQLWDDIANSPEYATDRTFWTKQIREKGDPHFAGDFSQDGFNAQERVATSAVNHQIETARKAGRQGDVNAFEKDKDKIRQTHVTTAGFDETQSYEDARASWLKVFTNPNSTPLEIDRANDKYKGQLNQIRDSLQKGLRPDEHDPRVGYLANEIKTMDGDEHPYEHWGGAFGPGGNTGGASATETAVGIKQNKADLNNLALRDETGQPVFVLTKMQGGDPLGTTEDNHTRAPWGVIKRDSMPEGTIYVIQNDYGDPRAGLVMTAVAPTPIHALRQVTKDDGTVETQQEPNPMAYHYTLPDGKTGYKYQDASGKWLYTPDNPFGTRVTKPDGTIDTVPLKPDFAGSKGATLNIPGLTGITATGVNAAILPEYGNPQQNVAMTSRIAKSGYGLWLVASDPKDGAAYAQKTGDILQGLRLEAGGDMNALREMVDDADKRRAVYLGNSTEEQNRLRENALHGIPSPVPLAAMQPKLGAGPSAEEAAIRAITGGPKQARDYEPMVGGYAFGATSPPKPRDIPANEDPNSILRKFKLSPTPPPAAPYSRTSPTSMGATIPGQIAGGLGSIISTLFGHPAPPSGAPIPGGPPKPAGIGPTLAGPPPPSAPKPTAAPKPAPPPEKPKPTDKVVTVAGKPIIVRPPGGGGAAGSLRNFD